MMFYDWSECAVSVLGTTKHSSCNCIYSCQYSCIFFTVSEKGIVESHTGLEVVRVVEWTGERFERPSCDHGLCLIVVQLKIVFKHPRLALQALVYDILPSTTAVFSYAIRPTKLSANEQFLVGAQTVVRLLQTTQTISDVCFITDHVAYTSSDKTTIV